MHFSKLEWGWGGVLCIKLRLVNVQIFKKKYRKYKLLFFLLVKIYSILIYFSFVIFIAHRCSLETQV